ncbi:hypothetical protein H257_12482 [Aphanomyces astaci]|uniref:Phosphatidylinositol-glycan biosynthesis class X protein n=1 Tax=Aphanomyces astaci TaxID=112090 RepID=W4G044_APHAT|nr:hypothetical protein H257_12482 [Aphanomyces astaci]ETV72318.1 hypothetical protein H257_12482 [Aphanomyces astaci]|eukprot:XP_009838000.1 hypothetical protein H257_12482 [Aphanomyces astaci]
MSRCCCMGWVAVCALLGYVYAERSATVQFSSAVIWPSALDDTLTIDEHEVRSTGDMTVVYDTSIDLTNKFEWHPSVDHVEVSVVRTPTLSDTSLWTNYIGPTVKTLHEAAGVHVRVHHRGSSSDLLDIQRHASVVLTSLFGTSDGSIDDPIAFASTVVYANASCDLSTSVLVHTSSPSPSPTQRSSFCLVSSRDALHVVAPTLFPSTQPTPLDSAVQRTIHLVGGIQLSSAWQTRATHFSLDKSQVLHMQEVVSSTAKGHDHVRITSPQLAKKSHVVGSIVHGAAHILSLVQPTDADAIVVVPSTTRHDVVRRAHSRMVGSGFHQVLRLTVESRIVPGNLHDEICSLLVSQTFPTTAYADMDELRRMERFHSFERVVSYAKHIEIERPAAVSSQHVVAFVVQLNRETSTIDIPVHFRYQFPSNTTLYRPVHLVAPSLHVHCKTAADVSKSTDQDELHTALSGSSLEALVRSEPYWSRVSLEQPLHALVVQIPVGNLNDGRFVTAVTLLVSVGGCLLLYLTLLKKRDTASPSSSAGPSPSWVPRHTKQA